MVVMLCICIIELLGFLCMMMLLNFFGVMSCFCVCIVYVNCCFGIVGLVFICLVGFMMFWVWMVFCMLVIVIVRCVSMLGLSYMCMV